jgi:hypothetical protein
VNQRKDKRPCRTPVDPGPHLTVFFLRVGLDQTSHLLHKQAVITHSEL